MVTITVAVDPSSFALGGILAIAGLFVWATAVFWLFRAGKCFASLRRPPSSSQSGAPQAMHYITPSVRSAHETTGAMQSGSL
jgi:hypothetical protein